MPDDELDPDFEELLAFVHESRGVDFTGYKRASLRRLVGRRMRSADVPDPRSYLDRLQVDPAELRSLFDSLLVNVTAFFRDTTAWEALREQLLPELLARLDPDEPVRVWSAACATGEEAYSLAILLHQVLGHEDDQRRVKVYATDVDEPALAVARAGRYAATALEPLGPDLRDTYFVPEGEQGYCFRSDLRQNVNFGRHDLLTDAPISRVSLLSCRNVLMYFTAETQARILGRFGFALHAQGLLFLGKAEMLLTSSDLFGAVDLPHRIFRRVGRRLPTRYAGSATGDDRRDTTRQVTEAAFVSSPDAQLVLDRDHRVVLVNDTAVRDLGVAREDVGRGFAQLELSLRPTELRNVVAAVQATGVPVERKDVRWRRDGQAESWWDVQVAALPGEGEPLGTQVFFTEVTRHHQLNEELTHAHKELQEAFSELETSGEELETTNEELQSAIEELDTTNEELQSTNEELETMNEELQSTNEELQTVNDELRDRTGEVGEVNAFLESILSGLQSGVAVVDLDLRVLVWNGGSERMWGLRAFEAEGENLLELADLPVEALRDLVRAVTREHEDPATGQVLHTNRFGHRMLCTLVGTALRDRGGDTRGVIICMDDHGLDPEQP